MRTGKVHAGGGGRCSRKLTARLLAAVAGLAGPAGLLAGCGTQAANVSLPAQPGHVRPAAVKAVAPAARDEVVAAYEGYWRATNEALTSRDAAKATAIMAGYVPGSAIPALVQGLKAIWRRHEIGYGSPVFHILSVTITGHGTAAVHDCVDLSHTGFQNQQTGRVVGGFGQSHDFMITTLVRQRGRWLVTGAIPVVLSCKH
jgi:hypothetical protein